MSKKSYITGAGVVPVFNNKDGIYSDLSKDLLYLVLIDRRGRYDFPKGSKNFNEGETNFECAIREMDEECNLRPSHFKMLNGEEDSVICGDSLVMYFGIVTSIENVKLKPNPELLDKGKTFYEHSGFKWMTYEEVLAYDDEAEKTKLRSFLIPAIEGANDWINKII